MGRQLADLIKKITKLSKKYEFTLDSEETLNQKGDVEFIMGLEGNVDPNKVKTTLENLAADVGYVTYVGMTGLLVCKTDKQTYERVFQTQLEHDQKKQGLSKYTKAGYLELKPATIPDELREELYSVHLNRLRK